MEEAVVPQYVAVVLKDADGDFRVDFPDLPGCSTRGATLDQACRFAAETLAFHLERLAANHLALPATRSLDTILVHAEDQRATLMLIKATALAN